MVITSTSNRPLSNSDKFAIKVYLQSIYGKDCKVIFKAPTKAQYERKLKQMYLEIKKRAKQDPNFDVSEFLATFA